MIKNQYNPDFVTPPGETLLETLEVIGMTQAEFAERTGRPKKTINEIIHGKAIITPETALQFEKVLGVPAGFWINREQNYQEWLAREQERENFGQYLSWTEKFPIKEMVELGWIEKQDEPIDKLNGLLRFFGIASPHQWEAVTNDLSLAFRLSAAYKAEPEIISAWLRKGEIEAQNINCEIFNAEEFRRSLDEIRLLTNASPDIFVPKTIELCAKAGVAVVFVHELRKLRTSGATRWLNSNKALIQLSLLYKTDDHLWFTFFHEAGHILLHGKKDIFLEGDLETNEKEEQANRFSADYLIPPSEYKHFYPKGSFFSKAEITEFSEKIGIAPGIVVGRLQHDERIPMKNCNDLKRKLRWKGDD
ncbi:MAG: HigA family addiction module antidote protein [Anaerolineales bacterium]|nr:HigA family addiction module antidote protein [Anaerolineales bacterium]